MNKTKIIRITTVPQSLKGLLKGQHRFMSENGFEVIGVSSSGKDLDEAGKDENIRTISIEMSRKITPLKDLSALWKFYRLCRKEKPTIVHSHTPKAGIIGMLGAKLAGVPVRLHTVAGLPLMEAAGNKRKLLDFVEQLTYKCATKVYPNSQGLYDFILQQKYTKESKLKVIGQGSSNGIDTSHFSPERISEEEKQELRTSLGLTAKNFIYVFVGRLVGDKGINELVEAFQKLELADEINSMPKLLLVGPFESDLDPLESETLQAIESNPNILSVGFQKDVRPYFAVSDVLAFPSYREGFPNVVMQAGAMGLPSIVSDINGCNEIIVEGENGTIVPVKNVEALHQAMERMMEDKLFYEQLKTNARTMIQSRYEQSVVWQALLEEYNSLLDNRS